MLQQFQMTQSVFNELQNIFEQHIWFSYARVLLKKTQYNCEQECKHRKNLTRLSQFQQVKLQFTLNGSVVSVVIATICKK